MTKKEFKVGDRVMCTDDGNLGVVTFVDIDEGKDINNGYEVKFDDGSEEWVMADMLTLSDEPPIDRKTAFLTELQALLMKHNACIQAFMGGIYAAGLCFCFDDTRVEYQHNSSTCEVDADNIMDFDK